MLRPTGARGVAVVFVVLAALFTSPTAVSASGHDAESPEDAQAGDSGSGEAGETSSQSGSESDGTTTTTVAPEVGEGGDPPPSAPVHRQREIEDRIRALNLAIGEASREESRLLGELRETQSQLDQFDATVASIDSELATANAALSVAQAQVSELDGRYVALTRRLRETTRAVDVAQDEVGRLAAELYRRAGGAEAAAITTLAFEARTPEDLFAGARYLQVSAASGRERIAALGALKDEIDEVRDELDEERDEAKAARDAVARERARIADLRARQEDARRQVEATVARQERLIAELQSKKSQFNAEIEALRAESEAIAGLLRNRQSGQELVPTGSGVLALPVNARITSGFGQRQHPILGTTRMHTGIDFGAGYGVPIRASDGGEVVWAGPRGGYGNTVIIDHGNALATLYAHQSSVSAGVGQFVERGQVIGLVGSTGLSTGPHLHFEVRVRGTPVDPLQYL